jgi:Tol biopolymer transport system component
MDYLEFIARVTSHIPDKGQVMVRYYGLYANAHRGKVRKANRVPVLLGMIEEEPKPITSKGWAEMIRKVYEVDPMICPRCGGRMKVVAFLTEYAVVDRIICHLTLMFAAEKPPPAGIPGPGFRVLDTCPGPRYLHLRLKMNRYTRFMFLCLVGPAMAFLAWSSDSHRLKGPYLGQKPPGMTPEVFAPGIISSADFIDFKGAFSPDGQEYYFYRHALPKTIPTLLYTKVESGIWTEPAPLKIAQGASTYHPCVSPDNQWLFFFWQFQPEQRRPSGFYASARTDTGWSAPQYAGPGMYLTCDNSGRFYTTESVWGEQPKHYLARMTFSHGRFSRPERLTIQPHYENQTHPCIAPDGSYILFDINVENGSLFVSFKDQEGHWGEGIDLTKHGFKPDCRGAYISPDGKYLFFSVDDDIWWVDIRVIENLRPISMRAI